MSGAVKKVLSVFTGATAKAPEAPTPAPLPPAQDPAAQEAAQRAAEEERRRVMQGGRAANILTGQLGDQTVEADTSAKKKLLGG